MIVLLKKLKLLRYGLSSQLTLKEMKHDSYWSSDTWDERIVGIMEELQHKVSQTLPPRPHHTGSSNCRLHGIDDSFQTRQQTVLFSFLSCYCLILLLYYDYRMIKMGQHWIVLAWVWWSHRERDKERIASPGSRTELSLKLEARLLVFTEGKNQPEQFINPCSVAK